MKKQMSAGVMVLVVAAVLISPVLAAPNFTDGNWEVKAEMKMEGLPFPMPPMPINYTQCITKKDMVPQKQEKNQECSKVSEKVEGNTISWVMKCKDSKGNVTESTGNATYAGTTFNAKINNVTTDPKGAKSTSTMTMNGRRTGDCK